MRHHPRGATVDGGKGNTDKYEEEGDAYNASIDGAGGTVGHRRDKLAATKMYRGLLGLFGSNIVDESMAGALTA